MEPLYIQPLALQFEKTAAEVTLPENANHWPNEIMQELYKQVPYIADFEPQVVMDRVDDERGYAFGHVEVQNKTELQSGADPEAMQAIGIQQVRIPVIIKNRKLYSFDVIITADSKVLPLNEGRMRQGLFRPQAFDVTSRTPGDMSMVGQLYPPQRQNYGGGGGGGQGMSVGMGKESSALEHFLSVKMAGVSNIPNSTMTSPKGPTVRDLLPKVKQGSIMSAILPTLSTRDYVDFTEQLREPGLQAAFMKNAAATAPTLQKLSQFAPRTEQEKLSSAFSQHIRPTVVQITKLARGYQVKTARHDYWDPAVHEADRGEVVRLYGVKTALAADESGSVTVGEGEGVKEEASSPEEKPERIASFGVYRVKEEDSGQELVGFVFPNLLDLDGTALPICLFTNGSVTGLQDDIVGESVGKDQGLIFGPEKGYGMFVRKLPNGSVDAMIPMTMKGGYAEGGSHKMQVETFDGRTVFVEQQPNIKSPVESEGSCLIPQDFQWMPLGGGECTLVSSPDAWGQAKEASRAYASVTLRSGGNNSFSLSGFPLEKFAQADLNFLSLDDTLFLLAGLGTDLTYGAEKMAHAILHNAPVEIRVGRHIKLAAEENREAVKRASVSLSHLPNVRRSLLKEAAFIPDPLAVDTVLSVGFINPENIMTFVSYLPQMEIAQSRLCELLIAARLGLQDIPLSPLEKAIKSVEEVIEGLKILAFSGKN